MSLRSTVPLLHGSVFILLFIEGHTVSLHLDIALVKARFAHESLVSIVSSVNVTLACVPEEHRGAFNLRSFLHESVFILLFTKGRNSLLHFDTAQVKARFTRESLVTNFSLVNLTVARVWRLFCSFCVNRT